jgi:protein involved in polysaccharide export with SLBB domain
VSSIKKSAVAAVVMAATCNALIPLPLHAQPAPRATTVPLRPATRRQAPEDVDQAGATQAGDLLSVTIVGLLAANSPTEFTLRVAPDGLIALPMLGGFRAAGQTPSALDTSISQMLRQRNLLPNAPVHVVRLEEAANATVRAGPLAKGDEVSIRIFALRQDDQTIVRGPLTDGGIELPQIGWLSLEGLSDIDAMQKIVKAYRDNRVLPNAMVEVRCVRRK